MSAPNVPPFVSQALERMDLSLSGETLVRLANYLDLLLAANEQFNLTAIRDRDQAWRRHILDSLTLLPLLADLPAQGTVIDVGSGGGLPGVVIAVARPDLHVTLLEATGKKARFLQQCVDQLPLPHAQVYHGRAEAAGQDKQHRQKHDAVVCRAVGPMAELLEYTLPLAKVGGVILAMKGPSVEAELENATDALAILGAGELDIIPSFPDDPEMQTVIVRIVKERPTPRAFPRRPGTPRLTPL